MDYGDLLKRHEEEASTFSEGKIYFIFVSTEAELIEELKKDKIIGEIINKGEDWWLVNLLLIVGRM